MSKPSDEAIKNAVTQGRGESVLPLIQYRQTLALEDIAEILKAIEALLAPPTMAMPAEFDPAYLKPGPGSFHHVGPATDVENAGTPRARRRRSEET